MKKYICAIRLVLLLIILFTSSVVNGSVFQKGGDYIVIITDDPQEETEDPQEEIYLPYIPPTDSDNDGMPDSWEITYGLNPSLNDADNDADNDGVTNLNEFRNNSYPNIQDSDNDGLLDNEESLLSGEEFRINSDDTHVQYNPKVATNGNTYFVAWRSADVDAEFVYAYSYSEICGQIYDSEGNKIGSEFKLNSTTTELYYIDSITSDGNNYLLTFSKESSWDACDSQIFAQLFDNEGNKIGSEFKISTYSGYEPFSEAASNGSNYFVTWSTLDRDGSGYGVYGQILDNDGSKIVQDFRINAYTTSDQRHPSIATDGNIYVVVWINNDSYIAGSFFDNEGNQIGSQFTITDPEFDVIMYYNLYNVNVAISNENCFVSWTADKHDGNFDDVYGQILSKDNCKIGSPFKINTSPLDSQDVSNVVSSGNNFLIIWDNKKLDETYQHDVIVKRYDSMGNAISREYPINDSVTSFKSNSHLAYNGKSIFTVWINDELNNDCGRVYGKLLTCKYDTDPLNPDSDNDGLTDGDEVNNYNTMPNNPDTDNDGLPDGWEINNNCNPLIDDSFSDDDNDGLSVLEEYKNGTSITNADTDNDGLLDSQEIFRIDLIKEDFQINTYTDNCQRYANLITAGDNYFVTWQSYGQDGNKEGVFGQLLDLNGNKIGDEIHISTRTSDDQENPYTASNGSTYFVTWQSYGQDGDEEGVYGQLLDLNGNKISSEFRINSTTYESQRNPCAASDSNNYFVAWQSYRQDGNYQGVYGQFYDSSGNKIASEFRINSYTTNNQCDPNIACNGNNYFVVWHSNEQDGSGYGIYGQLYTLTGNKIGSEFRINSYTTDQQKYPHISTNGDLYFVVWHSNEQDGSDYGIYGQFYDSEGNKIGSEFQINTYTVRYQTFPISASIGDNFLVTWQSNEQDESGYGIYGQFYDSEGNKIGSEFQINTYVYNSQSYPFIASNGINFFIAWQSFGQDNSNEAIMGKFINLYTNYFETNPLTPDTDNDGLLDGEEIFNYQTNPLNPDSDNDYLSDGYEILTSLTNPLDQDTDNDGMPDYWEINNNLNPLADDSSDDFDNDGLTNIEEYQLNTYADLLDSDNDGMPDGWEINNNLDPLANDSQVDIDEDGLSNLKEYQLGTDMNNSDSDNDGVPDAYEYFGIFFTPDSFTVEDLYTVAVFGDEISVFSAYQYSASYTSGSEIVGVVQDNNGDFIKEPFLVNSYTTSSQIYPFLGTNHSGYFVVWQSYGQDGSGYGIYGKLFDQYGNNYGNDILINTNTIGNQTNPSVASTGSNYLIVWASDNDIKGQYYSNWNYKIGSEFTVNTITSDMQGYPTVAATPSHYLITWETINSDGNYDIHGQVMDNNGQKIGSEFRINSYTTNNQTKPFVESNHTNFLVAWRSYGHENGEDRIYARYINNNGQPEGDEFYVYTGDLQGYSYPPSPAIMTDYNNYDVTWYDKNSNIYTIYKNFITKVQSTDPLNPDTDNDGLIDSIEFDGIISDPLDPDTDNDGILDGWEHNNGLNPKNDDSMHDNDGDNLTHLQEYHHNTNPFNADTDGDGIRDDIEIQYGLNPLVMDATLDYDNDGLTNSDETIHNTDPLNADSDNDGTPDGWEIQNGFNPNINDSLHDNDGDSLTNLEEYQNNTDPFNADTDSDGLSDSQEIFNTHTNPLNPDTDGDGLKDKFEVLHSNTNPCLNDSDNDGLTDNEELFIITQETQLSSSGINTNPDTDNGINPLVVWKNKTEDSGNYRIQGKIIDDSGSPVTDVLTIDEYSGLNEVENSFNLPTGYYLDLNNPSSGNYIKQACRFTAADTYPCKTIELKLQKKGNPTGQIWISLYTDGLYYPNTAIIESIKIPAANVSVNGEWVEFTFNESQSIVNGTTYWIVLESDYTAGANCVAWEWGNNSAQKNWCFYNGAWANYASYTVAALYKVYSNISPDLPENKMIPAAASDSQSYLVVWQSYRYDNQAVPYYGIFGQLVGSSGNLSGLPFLINTNTQVYQDNPVIASHNQGYCVAWEFHDNDGIIDIHYQYLNTDGSKNGSEEIFVENATNPVIASNGQEYFIRYDDPANQTKRQACIIPNGSTYFALKEEKNSGDIITGEFVNGDNQPVAPEFIFTFDSSAIWKNPSTDLCGNKYLLAWEELNQNDKLDISAQFIDDQGTIIEDKLNIAKSLQNNQQNCVVDANTAGFITAWESDLNGSLTKDIYSSFIKWGLGTDPLLADTDNDGVSDGDEILNYGCDPKNNDTDNDGITDGDEINIHNTIPTLTDTDNDGLSDGEEVFSYSSNPLKTDTDNDGMNDGDEVYVGMEPDNADSLFCLKNVSLDNNLNSTTINWFGSVASPDIDYKILWSDYPWGEWNEIECNSGDIDNNNGIRSWIDEGDNYANPPRPQPTNSINRFYKVIVE